MDALLATALIAYDANVLLNLYRYSEETRTGLVDVFKTFADRTHIPHQAALEYARNRANTIIDQVLLCEKAHNAFQNVHNEFIIPKNTQPFLSKKSTNALEKIKAELAASTKALEAMISEDPYADLLMSLFDEKISAAPDENTLQNLHEQAEARYDKKIPPGYAEKKNKELPQAYGDYIVWYQLIGISRENDKDLIFVTDDSKEDWKLTHGGRTIGFRPELREEFYRETGHRICLFTSEGFLIATKEAGSAQVADSVIQEIAEYRITRTSTLTSEDKLSSPTIDSEEANGFPTDLKSTAAATDKKTAPASADDGEEE